MPMQTFFNLPEDKRRTILRAARQEFSRVTLEQASIANIIKTANIPRGSFYQYFENKEDLYMFMMKDIGTKISDKTIAYLEENNGDIIEAFIKLFYDLMGIIKKDENAAFFKNVFLNMNDKIRDSLTPSAGGSNCEHSHVGYLKHLSQLIDTSSLALQDEKEIFYALKMMKGLVFQNLVPYFNGKITEKEATESYLFQMNLIRKAIYKS